jgi:hypothetical protein
MYFKDIPNTVTKWLLYPGFDIFYHNVNMLNDIIITFFFGKSKKGTNPDFFYGKYIEKNFTGTL